MWSGAAKAAKDKAEADEEWPSETRFTQLPPPQAGVATPPEDERPVHRPRLSERLSRVAEGRDQAVEPPQAASSFQGRHMQRAIETGQDAYQVRQSTAVRFHELESGHRSIRVDPRRVDTGERIPFRQRWGFEGTRYTASNVRRIVALGRIRDVFSIGPVVSDLVASVAGNVYDYTLGEHRDKGLGSREFWVSTGVDFGMNFGTGLLAAGAVALVITMIPVTLPLSGALALTAGAGLIINAAVDYFGVGDWLKEKVMQASEGSYVGRRRHPRGGPGDR